MGIGQTSAFEKLKAATRRFRSPDVIFAVLGPPYASAFGGLFHVPGKAKSAPLEPSGFRTTEDLQFH